MGVFYTVGVASAIGIGVAFLAAVTLLPAILVLAGPRGWVKPRRELTARFWRRSGIRIVRRPKAHLVASLLVLAILASCAALVRYNYDDRKALRPSAPSSIGYAALERHFPVSQSIPEYILIQSPRDLRTPQALADLEQMAQRVSQLPNIALVSGITRPTGDVPQEFRATYQAGIVGDRLADGSTLINDSTGDLNRLANGAGTLADNLGDVRGQINRIAPSMQGLIDAFSSMRSQYGGDKLVKDVDIAAKLVDQHQLARQCHGRELLRRQGHVRLDRPGADGAAGQPGLRCRSVVQRHPRPVSSSWSTRAINGDLDAINDSGRQLQGFRRQTDPQRNGEPTATTHSRTLTKAVHSMGLDKPGGLQANLTKLQQGADRFAGGSRQVADGVDQLVDQVKQMGAGLGEAAAFLLSMQTDAAQPAMAGFNIPAQLLHLDEFKKAAKVFISPDGHSVRYLVQTKLNPFSTEAMDQVNAISDTARGAQPNTALADATISMGGFPAALQDTRDYYEHDIRFIIAVTLVVVLLTLMALLRAIVAPLYLVASVVISYFVGSRYRRADISIPTRPAIALERAAAGLRGVGRGGRRLQHAACLANA